MALINTATDYLPQFSSPLYKDTPITVTATGQTLIVFYYHGGATNQLDTSNHPVTYDGVDVPLQGEQVGGANPATSCYVLQNPSVGTHNIRTTLAGAFSSVIMDAVVWDGVASIGAYAGINNGTPSNPLTQSITAGSGVVVIGYIGGSSPGAYTPNNSGTVIAPLPQNGSTQRAIAAWTNPTNPGFSWSHGTQQASLSLVALNPSVTNPSPTFPGPNISNITGTQSAALTPVNVSGKFSDPGDTLTYSASSAGTAWPSGVVINSSTGVISGTPTGTGTTTGCKVRATDTASQTVDSNAFNFVISAAATTGFLSDVIINNTGTVQASVAVKWTLWPGGRIGALTGITPTEGTGTTNSIGKLSVSGLSVATGAALLMVAIQGAGASTDAVYYEAVTIS